jgi:hypothetical protein
MIGGYCYKVEYIVAIVTGSTDVITIAEFGSELFV